MKISVFIKINIIEFFYESIFISVLLKKKLDGLNEGV